MHVNALICACGTDLELNDRLRGDVVSGSLQPLRHNYINTTHRTHAPIIATPHYANYVFYLKYLHRITKDNAQESSNEPRAKAQIKYILV